MTLKELSTRYNKKYRPETYISHRFKDTTEKGLKDCIRRFCEMQGYGYLPYDAKGRKLDNGKYAYSPLAKGAADCIVFVPHELGRVTIVVHVEIKMPGDRQRPHQKAFQEKAEARGERYIMPGSWEQFYALFTQCL